MNMCAAKPGVLNEMDQVWETMHRLVDNGLISSLVHLRLVVVDGNVETRRSNVVGMTKR